MKKEACGTAKFFIFKYYVYKQKFKIKRNNIYKEVNNANGVMGFEEVNIQEDLYVRIKDEWGRVTNETFGTCDQSSTK